MRFYILLIAALLSCSHKVKEKPSPSTLGVSELKAEYDRKQTLALTLRDDKGWLARQDCDSMIWTGKYAATADGVDIEAAEYPDKGKFGRRPPPWCWTEEGGDQGSKTTWSRDMAVAGLMPYIWLKARRDILERHIDYGKANNWQMGSPLADGRVLYTPALIGTLFKVDQALGAPFNANSLWPDLYPTGLVDYEAHLQVMSIWLQGEAAAKLSEGDAVPKKPEGTVKLFDDGEWLMEDGDSLVNLDISESMYQRLKEHADGEPGCPLYQVVYGIYSGDLSPAVDRLMEGKVCGYVRCAQQAQCEIADWLFSANLALKHLGGLK